MLEMIPQGLVLLTSVSLAIGVLNLSKINTLTQELSSIETLARVDILCLDKTGTLTQGKLKVHQTIYFDKDEEKINEVLGTIAACEKEQNISSKAIKDKYTKNMKWPVKKAILFSSKNKWQAIEFEKKGTWVLGAPDIIIPKNEDKILEQANDTAKNGYRVLALLESPEKIKGQSLPGDLKTKCLIALEDEIREDAVEIIGDFRNQGVDIKIISGDNIRTIRNLVSSLGLEGRTVDLNETPEILNNLQSEIEDIVAFGRVSPEHKQKIIEALQKNGHIVAMTGDGINDILALKQSNCGIAMGTGNDATKAVSKFVLLDSKFSSIPEIVKQGCRVINNISRSASLFITKTVYSVILSLLFSLGQMAYPFLAIQLSIISVATIGMPGFLLAFEPNDGKVRGTLLKKIIYNAIPTGIVMGLLIFGITVFKNYLFEGGIFAKIFGINTISSLELSTVFIIIIGLIQIWTLIDISRPLTLYRKGVIVIIMLLFIAGLTIPLSVEFFNLATLNLELVLLAASISGISIAVIWILKKIMRKTVFRKEVEI